MPTITPCLWFDGRAEQAAALYTRVFPNSTITHVQHHPPGTPGEEGTVMVVVFELDGQQFVGLLGDLFERADCIEGNAGFEILVCHAERSCSQ